MGEGASVVLVTGRQGVPEALETLASQARLTVQTVSSVAELAQLPRAPLAVLLPLASSAAPWDQLRAEPRWATVPLLAVAPEATELALVDTFARGGDDLLAFDRRDDVLAKLRALADWKEAMHRRGPDHVERRALIVGHDASWRASHARLLQRAGFSVHFAAPGEPLGARTAGATVGVIDASGGLEPVAATLAQDRAAGGRLPWIVAVSPDALGQARERLAGERASVYDRMGLTDALPFVVNELLASQNRAGVERRRSPRLLFATRVWARPAGSDQDRLGCSYTVSEQGIFWRSMAPLETGSRVWLELQPPRGGQRVRLSARVAWSRPFGPIGEALSPPGSGLEIEGGLPGDWELFQAGCQALLAGRVRR